MSGIEHGGEEETMAKKKKPMDPQTARALRMRRRKRHRMVFRILCVLIVCAAAVLASTVFFRVSTITVSGETRYDRNELIQTSGVLEGDNLFFLRGKGVVNSLCNTYPYLDTVELKRHLPDTLEIAVTERVPLMTVRLPSNGLYYVDEDGKVLEKVLESQIGDTVLVEGVEVTQLTPGEVVTKDTSEKITAVMGLLDLFERYDMMDKIVSVDISQSFNVQVNFDDRYTLELGTLDDLEHKIQFLRSILKQKDLPETGIIDLSDSSEAHYRPKKVEVEPIPEETPEEETDTVWSEGHALTDEEIAEEEQSGGETDSEDSENTDEDEQEDGETETDSDGDSSGTDDESGE